MFHLVDKLSVKFEGIGIMANMEKATLRLTDYSTREAWDAEVARRLELAKHVPMVYMMLNEDGTVYIGETTNIRHRYSKSKRETIVATHEACSNEQARQRQ